MDTGRRPRDTSAMPQAAAIVFKGHRIASGAAGDPRFPEGTIRPQLPFFRQAIPGLDDMVGGSIFAGTINLRIPGRRIVPGTPDWRVDHIGWTPHFPPETFFLSRGQITIAGTRHPVLLYLPDPSTKPDHFQPSDTIELLAAAIPGLAYGMKVNLHYRAGTIRLLKG